MAKQGFFRVCAVLLVLVACGQLTNTIYVPAMGQMAQDLAVTPAQVQAVMALYLIPYGFSQFIYGPLSDRFGRKPLMLIGLAIFIVGSLLAGFSHSFELLLIGSFIQGLGTGTGGVMSRTVMRDLYSGKELHSANSYISMGLIFTPLIAPIMGGWLSESWGWQANFWFLTGFGILVWFIVAQGFAESNENTGVQPISVAASYRHVMGHPQFQGYMVCLIATFAGIAVFEASAGVLFGSVLKLDPKLVSLLFIVPIPGYLLGSWASNRLSSQLNVNQIMALGICFLMLGALGMLGTGLLHILSITAILVPATLYFLGAGMIFPTATTGALEPFPRNAGVAGAVLGGMQNLGAGLFTLVASMIPVHNQVPLGAILMVLAILVVMMFHLRVVQPSRHHVPA